MKLVRYQVTNFRSVRDSGWITVGKVTALIGVNESGKTNLIIPLWKLNPAQEGEIQPTSDYPKKRFGEVRNNPGAVCFITGEFETEDLAGAIAAAIGEPVEKVGIVHVRRFFDGEYQVYFPNCPPARAMSTDTINKLVDTTKTEMLGAHLLGKEAPVRDRFVEIVDLLASQATAPEIGAEPLRAFLSAANIAIPTDVGKTSTLVPTFKRLIENIEELADSLEKTEAGTIPKVKAAVIKEMPRFVYYSNYGNLDSEIYLPHVVENLKRKDLGAKEAAKVRTLRVLFKFVMLSPDEVLELGQDVPNPGPAQREPTLAEIEEVSEAKRIRSILLQSAGTKLTASFRDWWKQGNYRFRFEADGDHFRIWVADEKRPEEVELESRSTGLQWFLSFYLVFLVESEVAHENSVLLLDEPGLSLHPLAQRDLSAFFEGLADTNQLVYTTHSPFLVDADRLDRARKVYVAADGATEATEDLRAGGLNQAGAAYAVYSALNISVAESLLLGCRPVIVEGPSDQHYLTTIKALLIGSGKIAPKRELVFPPSGGTKTARITASMLAGRDEALPLVLLDSDPTGMRMAAEMRSGLYVDAPERVLTIADYTSMPGSEIEDLFPQDLIARAVDRLFSDPDQSFADVVVPGKPIVEQIETWVRGRGRPMEKGWKVELSKRVKQSALDRGITAFSAETLDVWQKLFDALI